MKSNPPEVNFAYLAGSGSIISLFSQMVKFILQMMTTTILARLLNPSAFGIMAMATVMVNFATIFRDMGISTALIQTRELRQEHLSSAFWLCLGFGGVLTGGFILIAPLAGWIYNNADVTRVCFALSPTFLLGALTLPQNAVFQRRLQMKRIMAIDLVANIVGSMVGIICAYWEMGFWSLVLAVHASQISVIPLYWLLPVWKPQKPRIAEAYRLIRFGGATTLANMCNHFVREMDNLLIGKAYGELALGMYSKAYALLMLPINMLNRPIGMVLFPILCHLQNNPSSFNRYYQQGIGLLTFVGMPLVAWMFVAAHEIVYIGLGSQWKESAVIFRLLSLGAWFGTFNVAAGWGLLATGKVRKNLYMQLGGALFFGAAFLSSLPWGAKGVAAGFSGTSVLFNLIVLPMVLRRTIVRFRDLLLVIGHQAICSLSCGLIAWQVLETSCPKGHLLTRLAIGGLAFWVPYLCAWLLPSGRSQINGMLTTLRRIVHSLRKGPSLA